MSQVTRGLTEIQDARQVRRRLRLGEVLVSEGLTTEAEIHVALSQQKQQKGKRQQKLAVDMSQRASWMKRGRGMRQEYSTTGARKQEAQCFQGLTSRGFLSG